MISSTMVEPKHDKFIPAHLYSIWDGVFRRYKGEVIQTNNNRVALFFAVTKYGEEKRFVVSAKEGALYNKLIWLCDGNDENARDTLIAYEKEQIHSLQAKIEKHRQEIKLLEGKIRHAG